jgi:hypothetical protein
MGIQELDRVRQLHQLGSLKIVSILRVGVVMIMFAAMQAGDTPRWHQQAILVAVYAVAAVGAALTPIAAATCAVHLRFGTWRMNASRT